MSLRMITGALAVIAFSSAVGLSTPTRGREMSSFISRLQSHKADMPDDDELFPENRGAILLLRDHSHRTDNADWLKFETDPCGFLARVESRRSIFRQSRLADDVDGFDDQDPSDQARTIFGRWLSAHSEIAVIADAIDKSCDGNLTNDDDDDDGDLVPDILAGWSSRTLHRKNEPKRAWSAETFHIA